MNGGQLTAVVKAQSPQTRVFVVTANDDAAEQAYIAGADGYLIKPFTFRDIQAIVRAVVGTAEPPQGGAI